MRGNLFEIASIINEAFYYLNHTFTKAKKLYSLDKSLMLSPTITNIAWRKATALFINKSRLIHLKTKPFLTQLILDLNHIFQFSNFVFSDQSFLLDYLLNGVFMNENSFFFQLPLQFQGAFLCLLS